MAGMRDRTALVTGGARTCAPPSKPIGGIVRLHEIIEIVRVTSPVHVKFGLRNAPDLYPSGTHLEATAVALSRERVRRVRIGRDRRRSRHTSPAELRSGRFGP